MRSPRYARSACVGWRGCYQNIAVPASPAGFTHLYVFRLIVLDTTLAVPSHRPKAKLLKAMAAHLLVRVDLIARYTRT